jgi:DeoR family glycerol-3-phosphate regulon repressor
VNSNPRQIRLLEAVQATRSASLEQLAEMLGVAVQTVRRDVQKLSSAGVLARFHGGVRIPGSTIQNIAYDRRETLQFDAKERIARAIAAAIPNGCSLILNIGTTVEAVARALMGHRDLQIITNNLNVASILSGNEACEVIVASGTVRPRDRAIIGETTVDFMRQFKVDYAVIGVSSIERDGSLRDFDLREVKVSQTIIAQAREVWLAADNTKFNRPATVEVARLAQIDRLFTDEEPPAPFPALLFDAQVQCDVAHAPLSPPLHGIHRKGVHDATV